MSVKLSSCECFVHNCGIHCVHNTMTSFLGFIGPVTNIRSVIDNCTNISIYWDSPTVFCLSDEITLLHYNLTIIADDVTSSSVKTIIHNGTGYQFEDKNLFRHRYTYVITGVTELGEGISNNKTFSYQRGMSMW